MITRNKYTKSPRFLPWVGLIFFISFFFVFPQNPDWIIYNTTNSGLPHDFIQSLAIDKDGNKWIGTTKGLAKFDGDQNWTIYTMENSGLPSNGIKSIAVDSKNVKWLGFNFKGIARFDDKNWTFYNKLNSKMNDNEIETISIDKNDNVWVGTVFGGINKFNGDTTWSIYSMENSLLPSTWIKGIKFEENINVWIVVDNNLIKIDNNNKWQIYNSTNSKMPKNLLLNTIELDNNNSVWVGTSSNLLSFDKDTTWTVYFNSIIGNRSIDDLTFEKNGKIWIAMFSFMGGIATYDGDTTWLGLNPKNSLLPEEKVTSIEIDKYGNKWIGTYGGGLAVYREGGVVGVKDILKDERTNMSLFPNPVTSSFSLSDIPDRNVNYQIFDNLGIKVSQGLVEKEIDVSYLPSGVYFLKINNKAKPIKFLKM